MKTILIIEDHDAIRMLLAIGLEEKYRVITASNGVEGLRLFHEQKPNLIITDISMPGMSGYDLIRTIRAQGHSVKIIAYSAVFANANDVEKAYEAGANICLAKPAGIPQLEQTIEELFTT